MTKYYYKGQLIRTSKTRNNYEYALFLEYKTKEGNDKLHCLGCSSRKELLYSNFKYQLERFEGYKSTFDGSPFKVYIDKIEKVEK